MTQRTGPVQCMLLAAAGASAEQRMQENAVAVATAMQLQRCSCSGGAAVAGLVMWADDQKAGKDGTTNSNGVSRV